MGEDLYDEEELDGNHEITREFSINPSVDILYFTSHAEDHYFQNHPYWNGNELRYSKECAFLEDISFPVDEVINLLMGCSEIEKDVKYLAFNLDLTGV